MNNSLNLLKCPQCGGRLEKIENSLKCGKGHCFDFAHGGYVNLLSGAGHGGDNSGDNKMMVDARLSFLQRGFYEFLVKGLESVVTALFDTDINILDLGCGVGYYTQKLGEMRRSHGFHDNIIGMDISKNAIKIATKIDKNANYYVASVFDAPCQDGAFEIVISVFAPYKISEFRRVLTKNGRVLVVYPSEKHLLQLKQLLYGERAYLNDKKPNFEGLVCKKQTKLTQSVQLEGGDIASLLEMTPYFYKTSEIDKARIADLKFCEMTFDFNVVELSLN